jgi:hypothetical protein
MYVLIYFLLLPVNMRWDSHFIYYKSEMYSWLEAASSSVHIYIVLHHIFKSFVSAYILTDHLGLVS